MAWCTSLPPRTPAIAKAAKPSHEMSNQPSVSLNVAAQKRVTPFRSHQPKLIANTLKARRRWQALPPPRADYENHQSSVVPVDD